MTIAILFNEIHLSNLLNTNFGHIITMDTKNLQPRSKVKVLFLITIVRQIVNWWNDLQRLLTKWHGENDRNK